jgi:NAD+ synthase
MTTALQAEIIATLGVKPVIDVEQEIRARVNFLKEFTKHAGTKGFVLGISGGQDSSLAGKLAQTAAEELRADSYDATFTAVRLPYGVQKDEDDAQLALAFIKPDNSIVFNIKEPVDAFQQEYLTSTAIMTDFTKGNVKARSRMIAQYAIAGQNNLLVIGTDHAAEAVSGFFTKFGDGGADILPLSGLTKRQGKALLKALNAHEGIYMKVPTADLLDNIAAQPDETELGITYDELDNYLEGKDVSDDAATAIETRYLKTEHKRQNPVTPFDAWWK